MERASRALLCDRPAAQLGRYGATGSYERENMKRRVLQLAATISLLLSSSCFPFSGDEYPLDEPYYLAATDVSKQMSLYRRIGKDEGIGRVEPTVFAAGWDKHHIIVQRHPNGDRSRTEFFILDLAKDDAPERAPSVSVTGPFTAGEFAEARTRAGVAPGLSFTLVLSDLK